MSTIQHRVPTLPTPTTLRARSDHPEAAHEVLHLRAQRRQVALVEHPDLILGLGQGDVVDERRAGRRCDARPSTTSVSLATAWSVSWVRALATAFSGSRMAALPTPSWSARWSEQVHELVDVDLGVPDVEGVHGRQLGHPHPVGHGRRPARCRRSSSGPKPFSRAATARLAARRLTSHSHGPGMVSSKSLTSKIRWRSGVANSPKFIRWASPQACTQMSVRGVSARSAAIIAAAPR